MTDFLDRLEEQVRRTICIDFDGVLHKNSKGYHNGTIYDEPIEGAKEGLEKLAEKYDIVIFTCKARPERPLVNGKTGEDLVWEWLKKYDMWDDVKHVTAIKMPAKYYIDDKGITFKNWKDLLEEI